VQDANKAGNAMKNGSTNGIGIRRRRGVRRRRGRSRTTHACRGRLRSSSCGAGRLTRHLDVDVETSILITALLFWITGAIFLAVGNVGSSGGNVVCAPAVVVLDDSIGPGARCLAMVRTFTVRLVCPEV
jgi:hypothetical protein